MATAAKTHPHRFTLDLLRIAVERLPPTFSAARKKSFMKRLEQYQQDKNASYEDIRETIAEIGRESWSARKAYEEMYARYGRASEEAHLLTNLDEGVRAKYERFLHEGGKINHVEKATSLEEIRQSPFENYFSPEEKYAILQALLAARDQARAEIDELVTVTKKDEYARMTREYKTTQRLIESKIEELRALAAVSPKWRPDIQNRIRTIEEGWSVVEQGVDLNLLEKETEHWRGTLESFLTA
jgi:predicted  nucleic acid-binding Zn-ribbon protein